MGERAFRPLSGFWWIEWRNDYGTNLFAKMLSRDLFLELHYGNIAHEMDGCVMVYMDGFIYWYCSWNHLKCHDSHYWMQSSVLSHKLMMRNDKRSVFYDQDMDICILHGLKYIRLVDTWRDTLFVNYLDLFIARNLIWRHGFGYLMVSLYGKLPNKLWVHEKVKSMDHVWYSCFDARQSLAYWWQDRVKG